MRREQAYELLIPITRAMNEKKYTPNAFEKGFIDGIKYRCRGQGYRLSAAQDRILQDIHRKATNGN